MRNRSIPEPLRFRFGQSLAPLLSHHQRVGRLDQREKGERQLTIGRTGRVARSSHVRHPMRSTTGRNAAGRAESQLGTLFGNQSMHIRRRAVNDHIWGVPNWTLSLPSQRNCEVLQSNRRSPAQVQLWSNCRITPKTSFGRSITPSGAVMFHGLGPLLTPRSKFTS